MKPRTVLYAFLLLVLTIFLLANWQLLAAPATLNLLVADVQAPAGIVGLAILAVILIVDWSVHALARRGWERERRQLIRDNEQLQAQVTNVEASRLRTLEETMTRECSVIRQKLDSLLGRSATPQLVDRSPDGPMTPQRDDAHDERDERELVLTADHRH